MLLENPPLISLFYYNISDVIFGFFFQALRLMPGSIMGMMMLILTSLLPSCRLSAPHMRTHHHHTLLLNHLIFLQRMHHPHTRRLNQIVVLLINYHLIPMPIYLTTTIIMISRVATTVLVGALLL